MPPSHPPRNRRSPQAPIAPAANTESIIGNSLDISAVDQSAVEDTEEYQKAINTQRNY
jgi:hypothetical protein